ncbi:NnrU family protein [Pelagibacterium lentulum]|uniref:Nitrate reductase n=1 Tax=Pelagibacterium lentulum TaxID=2029865 RepID=A0A916RNK8_9HYPH|nr:NnrU family protein [Pelagibacterium lentulum]GGA60885.1 nitrate reductase [Pelagibacterium lentulum]
MLILLLGLVLFLGMHSVNIVAPNQREAIIAQKGEGAWLWPYTAIAGVGFVLIIFGYGIARQDPVMLYAPPTGMRHLALAVMIPVFPLLLASYLPGHIKARVKHPMLIATILWAIAHLLANGTLADVALFGGFLVWAIADLISLVRRPEKNQRTLPRTPVNDIVAVIGGLAIYAAIVFWLHQILFGVSPI